MLSGIGGKTFKKIDLVFGISQLAAVTWTACSIVNGLPAYSEISLLKVLTFYSPFLVLCLLLTGSSFGLLRQKGWGYKLWLFIALCQIPTIFIKGLFAFNISTAFVLGLGYSFNSGIIFNLGILNIGFSVATQTTPHSLFAIDIAAVLTSMYFFFRLKAIK